MENVRTSDSPLETVEFDMGSNATEAFSILGNEMRLAVLAELRDELEPLTQWPATGCGSRSSGVGSA